MCYVRRFKIGSMFVTILPVDIFYQFYKHLCNFLFKKYILRRSFSSRIHMHTHFLQIFN